ncbi:type II toxin-antitoxin system VapC family toxin [Fibrisoma montanum]|uniref:Type II toxin-antitoxin system VapC family toxin n=1 Tax=Fibrisoma montanum TaxID=2305895 RepID=A0A418M7P2_9BACT|nr:type II toxin-antitoxin system VapC family toxin [Fibrisoma montanum]RIV22157.1 type II toxin-antitoxin system VapC family toxin [Fibrisoma montanum]
MGKAYLIDTSAYSKYLSGLLLPDKLDLMAETVEMNPIISVITRIELLSWVAVVKEVEASVREFITVSSVLSLDEPVILQTIRLRRQYRSVKLPDAIIAATALVYDFTLLPTNDSDFQKIDGLNYQSLSK